MIQMVPRKHLIGRSIWFIRQFFDHLCRSGIEIDRFFRSGLLGDRAAVEELFGMIEEGLIITDYSGRIQWLNRAAIELMSSAGVTFDQNGLTRAMSEYAVRQKEWCWRDATTGSKCAVTVTKRQISLPGRGRRNQASERIMDVFLLTKITEHAWLERDVLNRANHDPLTCFASRLMLFDHIKRAIARAAGGDTGFAVLMVDIDHFHLVNDTEDFDEGDRILLELTRRIQDACRADNLIIRHGNDSFFILIECLKKRRDAAILAEEILYSINRPIKLQTDSPNVSTSCGISVWPDDSSNGSRLVRNAELALRKIKQQGNNYHFFSKELESNAKQECLIRQELRAAVHAGDFKLYFQPQILIKSGQVTGFEALIRWPRPGQDMIPPSKFIPIAENAGFIEAMTDWVARTAIAQSQGWRALGYGNLGMSINVSAYHFVHANIAEDLSRILREQTCGGVELTIEITESMLMSEPKKAVSILEQLKSMGIKIAIDDFGTGYSSLAYLRQFPIDSLKIDRTFIAQIGTDRRQDNIVAAIAQLSRSLGLRTVAEGIETLAQAKFVAGLGCEEAQGFYYSQPVPASSVPIVLANLNKRGRQTADLVNVNHQSPEPTG